MCGCPAKLSGSAARAGTIRRKMRFIARDRRARGECASRYAAVTCALGTNRDPQGPTGGDEHVLRGGGERVSERVGADPVVADHLNGFRCAGEGTMVFRRHE